MWSSSTATANAFPHEPNEQISLMKSQQSKIGALSRLLNSTLIAGLRPATSVVRQRIAFPLLFLGAGWLFVAGLGAFSSATAENVLKVLRLESPAGEGGSANWRQAAFDPAHTAFNRVETILSPSNVGHLAQAWAAPVGTLNLFASPA